MAYSDYEIGTPYRKYGSRGYFRSDLYTPTGEHDRIFVTGKDDFSPIFHGQYNAACSCCWLGFGHSEKYHEKAAQSLEIYNL